MSTDPQARPLTVTVVGAGIAGLTAAFQLQKSGYTVAVVEASDAPGGRMTDRIVHGLRYDTGARLIYSFSDELLGLIAELNLTGELLPALPSRIVARTGHTEYPLTMGPSASILTSPVLRPHERASCLRLVPDLIHARRHTDPNTLVTAALYDDGTLRDYLDRTHCQGLGRYYVEPMFRGARCWNIDDVSPAFFLSTSAHVLGARRFKFRKGIGQLTRTLASRLTVRYGARVDEIARLPDDSGCVVAVERDGRRERLQSDLVVCAVEGSRVGGLISTPTREESAWFGDIRYSPGGAVHYGLRQSLDPAIRFSGPDGARRISIVDIAPQDPEPDGNDEPVRTRISCFLSPDSAREVQHGGGGNLEAALGAEQPEELDRFSSAVVCKFEQWIEHMLPIPYPGYIHSLSTFLAYQSRRRRRIYYVGDYMAQALIGGACRSGMAAVENIHHHWPHGGEPRR